jgi:hypothetical protein
MLNNNISMGTTNRQVPPITANLDALELGNVHTPITLARYVILFLSSLKYISHMCVSGV